MRLTALTLQFCLSVLFLCAGPARAAVTITVNSNGGSPFADSSGTLLTDGSIVRVGYFDLGSTSVLNTLQNSSTFSEIDALFTPLAEGLANAGTVNQSGATGQFLVINSLPSTGAIFGSIQGISASYFTAGMDLSVWVFNHSSLLSATEWGIFSATTQPSANWGFPNDLGASTLSTFEIDTVVRGQDTGSQFLLAPSTVPVPEPGSLLLVMTASGLFAGRRRRRC